MAAQVDDLELLVAYYTDLDPRPELFGELLARCLDAEDCDTATNGDHEPAGWPKER
jgi:hypothetical protein